MSNLGRPVCQLQREKAGEEKEVMPYNHIVRMMLGDAVECIMEVLLRVAGLNITGGKEEAELEVHGQKSVERTISKLMGECTTLRVAVRGPLLINGPRDGPVSRRTMLSAMPPSYGDTLRAQ